MNKIVEKIISVFRSFIPAILFRIFQPPYHRIVAWLAAIRYRNPSRKLIVIGVTGTNGKSTTVELIVEILEAAGYKVASVSSIRFRIDDMERLNDRKMTMPGRFFVQWFLRKAVHAGCTHAVLEVTSEGIKQYRHKYIKFDVAVITNITPEHIESHGSFEAYRDTKAQLFRVSPAHVLNKDDADTYDYLSLIPCKERFIYSKKDFPRDLRLHLPGEFNRENALAALGAARAVGVSEDIAKRAMEKITYIPGRLEIIQEKPFGVVVDYAHTPDALRKVYESFSVTRLICVLGSAGGGRDVWKRPEMGKIAAEYCASIILTNEDPYDEPPENIIEEVEAGVFKASNARSKKIDYHRVLDRREAIQQALRFAKRNDVVVITGKGCEMWIMGPKGEKIPWDDREVAREELKNISSS